MSTSFFLKCLIFLLSISMGSGGLNVYAQENESGDYSGLNSAPVFIFEPNETKNIVVEFNNNKFVSKFGLLVTGENDYDYGTFYRPSDYDVTSGILKDKSGSLDEYEAFALSKPGYADKIAENILYYANWIHVIYYFDSKEDHTLYSFSKNSLHKIGEIKSGDIQSKGASLIDESLINPSQIKEDTTFVFIPSSVDINGYTKVREGVFGVIRAETKLGQIIKYSFEVDGVPFDVPADYNHSPFGWENNYAPRHNISSGYNGDGSLDILWLDNKTQKILHTVISKELDYSTNEMPLSLGVLGGFVKDEIENLYYYTFGENSGKIKVAVVKINPAGEKEYITYLSTNESDINFADLSVGTSRISYGYNTLALLIEKGRFDGHQDCNLSLINTATGTMNKNIGNICSHSFDHRVFFNGSSFISMNLGDNYPRGIQIGKISLSGSMEKKVVFTYKTMHSSESKGDLPAGKWSNDNNTYTELGNIAASDSGYVIVFVSEKSTDNSNANDYLNESRNIGMVHITQDFYLKSQEELIVNNDIVISSGEESDDFYYYAYGGEKISQKNSGVVWVTDYTNMNTENASRVNMISTGMNRYFLAWEIWGETYNESFGVVINENGEKQSEIVSLGSLRLPKGYEMFLYNNNPAWIIGNSNDNTLELYILDLDKALSGEPVINTVYDPEVYILEPNVNLSSGFYDIGFSIIDVKKGNIKEGDSFYLTVKAPEGTELKWSFNDVSIQDSNAVIIEEQPDRIFNLSVKPVSLGSYHIYLWAVSDEWSYIGAISLKAMRDIEL